MPLYKVTQKGVQGFRLINARTGPAALRHAATPLFQIEAITNPVDAAEMASIVKLEVAGDEPGDSTGDIVRPANLSRDNVVPLAQGDEA